MPGAKIGKNAVVEKSVIGANAVIGDGATVGTVEKEDNIYASKMCTHGLVLIEGGAAVADNAEIPKGSMVEV